MSFTTGTLFEREAVILASLWAQHRDWTAVKQAVTEGNLFQARSTATQAKVLQSSLKRVSALTAEEILCLPSLLSSERVNLLWAAACRRFAFIGEFAEEVVRARYLTLEKGLTYAHYDRFFQTKTAWHPELETLADSTKTKLRANIFGMMRGAHLINRDGTFEPVLFSPRVRDFLAAAPSDLRFFPVREF